MLKKIMPYMALVLLVSICVFGWFLNFKYYVETDLLTFDEMVTVHEKNMFLSLLQGMLIIALFCIIGRFLDKASNRVFFALYILISLGILVFGIMLARYNPYPSDSDQYLVWHMAEYFEGFENQPPYEYTPNYWIKYPQQKTAVVLLSWFISVIHRGSEYYFRLLNALLYTVFCLGMKKLTDLLYGSRAISAIAFLLTVSYLPTVFYVNYVYGTVFSLTAVVWIFVLLIGAYREQSYIKKFLYFLLCIIISIIANSFYMPTLIATLAILAFSITFFIANIDKGIKIKSWILKLLCVVAPIIVIFAGNFALDRYCSDYFYARTGIEDSKGLPKSGWILMGISETDGVNGPGSYTGLTDFYFAENNYDTDKTDEAIRERISKTCKEYLSGERSLGFFVEKEIIQWTDPWFASLTMTFYPQLVDEGVISDAWKNITSDKLLSLFERIYSVVLQAIFFLAVVGGIVLWFGLRSDGYKRVYWALPAFYIIGGFVFQLFWESKSRYCMPYFFMIIPFAAYGCHSIIRGILNGSRHN